MGTTTVRDAAVVQTLRIQLDEGEAEVIALAMELGEVVAVLDDKKARRIAKQLGLTVMGTVGLLLCAKRMQLIPAIAPFLVALPQAGFHVSEALVREALRLSGEDRSS